MLGILETHVPCKWEVFNPHGIILADAVERETTLNHTWASTVF